MILEFPDAPSDSVFANSQTLMPSVPSRDLALSGAELIHSSSPERDLSAPQFWAARIADSERDDGSAMFGEMIHVLAPDPTWIRRRSSTF